MSLERHPSRYRPAHRSHRDNKVRRGHGSNGGSRMDHVLRRQARSLLRARLARLLQREGYE